jgi:hypothetical protein
MSRDMERAGHLLEFPSFWIKGRKFFGWRRLGIQDGVMMR